MPASKKSTARSIVRPRARKKAAPAPSPLDPTPTLDLAAPAPLAALEEIPDASGSLEGSLLMGLGLLLVIGALFPRSLRQLLMLSLGGSLFYRGARVAPR